MKTLARRYEEVRNSLIAADGKLTVLHQQYISVGARMPGAARGLVIGLMVDLDGAMSQLRQMDAHYERAQLRALKVDRERRICEEQGGGA